MKNKLATIKYLSNNFKVIEDGDHVICAISAKKLLLNQLTYCKVESQDAYVSYIEAFVINESIIGKIKKEVIWQI